MKRTFSARAIAFGGLGAALATLAVLGAYYVPNLSVALNVLASVGILLPLTQNYYGAAFLAYAVAAGVGGALTQIHVLPFVLLTGLFPPFTLLLTAKVKAEWVRILLKAAFAFATFGVLYGLAGLFVVDLKRLHLSSLTPVALYFLFQAVYLIAVFVYDVGIRWVFAWLKRLTEKIKK